MKQLLLPIYLALNFFTTAAETPHEHEKNTLGPNGGLVLTQIEPHAEILIQADRTVQLTILSEDLKAAPLGGATVKLTGGDRSAPTVLTFTEKNGALISDAPLPDGQEIPVILKLQSTPAAEPTTIRLNLNLTQCTSCDHLEYTCICEH